MPDTSLIGLTLAGRFRITGVIGEGGMATVYRGTATDRPDEVAIEIMNPDLAKETRFVRRFRREAKAASMLKHANTVQILEFGVDQGYVYLSMELLRGFDLAMLLHRERRIPEARAVQIVIQVCRALSAAHEQSIIHRDLKPDNIMLVRQPAGMTSPIAGLGPNDFVKVLDFGIAKILDDDGEKPPMGADSRVEPITQEKSMLTRVGTIVGTPAYMAPEQGRAEAVDARTDLYACGVLLYELITGKVPFTGETPMQVVMRHVNETPQKPSSHSPVNPELERLIMRALAKYPSERQQSAEEMAFELLRVLPILAPPKVESEALADVKRTLVLDQSPSGPANFPNPGPPGHLPAPRPAAGAPAVQRAPVPAAGSRAGPVTQAYPPTGGGSAPAPVAEVSGPAPFPTLNIEVPDDIFPQGFGATTSSASPGSSEPEPTRRVERGSPTNKVAPPVRPAAGAPPVVPAAPAPRPDQAIPVVAPGAERVGLDQTMQSHGSIPPPASEDEEEAPTVLKAPTETDKARMSLAEEAMAKALGRPPPAAGAPLPPALGFAAQGLPKFSGPEAVEPTLVAGAHPQEKTAIAGAPPPPPAPSPAGAAGPVSSPKLHGAAAGPAPMTPPDPTTNLKNLQATMPLEPEQVEKALQDALARRATAAGPAAPAPPPRREPTPLPLDKPNRRPTSELIPVHLPDEAAATAPDAPLAPAPVAPGLVWEPKAKRLSGATALVVGIAIGALLVAVAIGLLLLFRSNAGAG